MFNKARLSKKKADFQKIALSRIESLFNSINSLYSDSYFSDMSNERRQQLARCIAMKYNISIPKDFKKAYCKHCHNHFVIGENVRIRVNNGKIVYYCLECKKYYRIPIDIKKEPQVADDK